MFKWYRKITIWSRWNKNSKQYEHNHIEPEWVANTIPQGHKSWKSGIWLKNYGWLDYKNRVHVGNPLELILILTTILIWLWKYII